MQVVMLVISNLAMIPSLFLCHKVECWILLVVLSASMTSSMLYHICDTEVYCAGVAFDTWQVVDNLFCILSITSLILYYAPVSSTWFSTVVFVFMAMLVSPVSSAPTNPMNGIGGALLAIAIVGLQWAKYIYWNKDSPVDVDVFDQIRNDDEDNNDYGNDYNPSDSKKQLKTKFGNYVAVQPDDEEGAAGADTDEEISNLIAFSHKDSEIGASTTGSPTRGRSRDRQELELTNVRSSPSQVSRRTAVGNSSVGVNENPGIRTGSSSEDSISAHSASVMSSWVSVGTILRICMQCRRSRPTIGAVLVTVGIASFANQNKDNYWLLHSMWHICMMLGGYIMLLSRNSVMSSLQRKR
jgi:hypothetical protein